MLMYHIVMGRNCHTGRFIYSLLVITSWLTGCSSHIPEIIKTAPPNNPALQQVYANTNNYLSQKVRWGGKIVDTQNLKTGSQLSIVAFPLNNQGKPIVNGNSSGRFMAITNDFLEPMVYSNDRHITVIGRVLRTETHNIGDFPYKHVMIQIDHHYLWPVEEQNSYANYPPDFWWYDPWYPWYPYHPHYYPHRY